MSKSLVLMIGVAVGLTLFLSSCGGGDDVEDLPSMDIPLAFLSPMAAGDYTVRITITAADIPNQIVDEHNLAIVEGSNQTYEVTVNDVPVGNQREVNVEVFKTGNRLFVGSGTVNISSGENQLAIRLEKMAELLIINISPSAATLEAIGATMQLSVTVKDEKNQPVPDATVNWSSSTPAVVSVSASGLITARDNGTAIITATSEGTSTAATVTVAQKIVEINITPASATLEAIGATMQLSVTVKDEKNQFVPGAAVNWSSSNPSVVSVNPHQGLATARGNGKATITAKSGAKSWTADITVKQLPTTIEITPAIPPLIAVRQTLQLGATARDPRNNLIAEVRVNWTSSNPSVATVSSTGLVTALRHGRTAITARVDHLSHTVSIVVPDTTGPSIVTGTVSNGDVRIDVERSNAVGFRFDFNEPIIGSIKLTNEAGESLNWIANVLGQTATLTVVPGKELVGGRTYKIEIDVKDGVGNRMERTITFVTDLNK